MKKKKTYKGPSDVVNVSQAFFIVAASSLMMVVVATTVALVVVVTMVVAVVMTVVVVVTMMWWWTTRPFSVFLGTVTINGGVKHITRVDTCNLFNSSVQI
jgi:hypothetical protein